MDWQLLISAVASLGFPIVCCGAMGWYVKYITDHNREDVKQLNENHTQEMMAFKDEITAALNNNTLAINNLCNKLGGVDDGR